MPVNSKHKEYTERAPQWQQMRDFVAGEQAVHAAAETYLPRLVEEPNDLYAARLARTSLFGATERTVEGLVGMLFRSKPERKVSTSAEKMLLDVTKSGEDVDKFASKCADEYETVGKVAILVDYPPAPVDENGKPLQLTVAQVEERNVRPNLARYAAESLINWEYGWVNNRTMLTLAVLEETYNEPNPDDAFAPKPGKQWRELRLVGGVYTVQLWRQPPDGGEPVRYQGVMTPQQNNKPLTEIPLYIIGDGKPPLLALCNVNKHHYQVTSDLRHGAHQTALPQPWIAGDVKMVGPNGEQVTPVLYIGGGMCWTFGLGTQVGMLEYSGQGLGALQAILTALEGQMAVLGARMLEAQKNGVEAADTAGMHRAGEQSILQRQAGELSTMLERALAVFDRWAGGTGDVRYQINKDFLPTALTAPEIKELVGAWQAGAISQEELFGKFQRGGVVSEGTTFEDEQTKIANNPPLLAAPAAPTPGGSGGPGAAGGA